MIVSTKSIPFVLHRVVEGRSHCLDDLNVAIFERLVGAVRDDWILVSPCRPRVGRARQYVLTFDDGNISDYEVALPILQRHRVGAVFFIVSSWIGQPGFMNWEQVRELHRAGMQIGSHSATHPYLPKLSKSALCEELIRSREIIEDQIGARVDTFAIPFGATNNRIEFEVFSADYVHCCTSKGGDTIMPGCLIPRNALHSGTTFKELELMLRFSPAFSLRVKVRYICKSIIKGIIGHRRYLWARSSQIGQLARGGSEGAPNRSMK